MIRFIEVVNDTDFQPRLERVAIPRFSLQEVWINEKHVTDLRESPGYAALLKEGSLPPDLSPDHGFTTISVSTGGQQHSYVVVGEVNTVAARLNRDHTRLLKG